MGAHILLDADSRLWNDAQSRPASGPPEENARAFEGDRTRSILDYISVGFGSLSIEAPGELIHYLGPVDLVVVQM